MHIMQTVQHKKSYYRKFFSNFYGTFYYFNKLRSWENVFTAATQQCCAAFSIFKKVFLGSQCPPISHNFHVTITTTFTYHLVRFEYTWKSESLVADLTHFGDIVCIDVHEQATQAVLLLESLSDLVAILRCVSKNVFYGSSYYWIPRNLLILLIYFLGNQSFHFVTR